MKLFKDTPTQDTLAALLFNPLPEVSPVHTGVKSLFRAQYEVSKRHCKSQSYTSSGFLSHCFVASLSIDEPSKDQKRVTAWRQESEKVADRVKLDIPTEEELSKMSNTDKRLYQKGVKVFIRNIGLLSKKQLRTHREIQMFGSAASASKSSSGAATKGAIVNVDTSVSPTQVSVTQATNQPASIKAAEENNPTTVPLQLVFSDVIPVHNMAVITSTTLYESHMPIPYSASFNQIVERLSVPSAVNALGAIVRGVSTRDENSLIWLVKSVKNGGGSFLDVAPLVRLHCLLLSLNSELASIDIAPFQMIRRWKPDCQGEATTYIAPPSLSWPLNGYNIIAMTLDGWIAFMQNKFDGQDVYGFKPSCVDADWVAIPIRTPILYQKCIIPYIAGFLHSELWHGKINHVVGGQWLGLDGMTKAVGGYSLMPSANSVHIPGPKNAILVLLDYTSYANISSVRISVTDVPVWGFNRPAQGNPANFGAMWERFFTLENADLDSSIVLALNEMIRYNTENCNGLAGSIAAEVYNAMSPGIMVQTQKKEPSYDPDSPALGAWVISDSVEPIDKKTRLKAEPWPCTSDTSGRRNIVGFNFSKTTSLHFAPVSLSKLKRLTTVNTADGSAVIVTSWSDPQPYMTTPRYKLSSATSINRVAISLDLLVQEHQQVVFSTPGEHACWIHMLSQALAFQTSAMLSSNNVLYRHWAGYDTGFDDIYATKLQQKIRELFQDVINYVPVRCLVDSVFEWDESMISDYYGIDPFSDQDWYTTSPVPYHATKQWMKKLGLSNGEPPGPMEYVRHNGVNHYGVRITSETLSQILDICSTIDFERYHPICSYLPQDGDRIHLGMWVDQFAHMSNRATKSSISTEPSHFETETFTQTI